jgi:DNA-binding NarL/FixJ family response regulator
MASILLADDHQIVRFGLRALLEAEADLSVVAEAADGLEARALLERLQPDVIILDLMLPGMNGLEVSRLAPALAPRTKVLMLSMHSNVAYIHAALRHGVSGYLLKQANMDELVPAVRAVLRGDQYLSRALSPEALDVYAEQAAAAATADEYESLTPREREVLQLAAEGHTNIEIAERLVISSRTVEMHRARLMRKLGLRNHADLVRYALWRGLLPLDH